MRHMATKHIEGSRTSAPRDDAHRADRGAGARRRGAADEVPEVPVPAAVPDDRSTLSPKRSHRGSDEEEE